LDARKKGHKLPVELDMRDQLLAYADRLLRFELRFHSLELDRHRASMVRHWGGNTSQVLHSQAMEKLEISEAAMLKPDVIEGLAPRLAMAYQSWMAGHDLRNYFSRASFYRYRAELLKHGVDIALARPRIESNVIPLRVVLHAYPVGVPEWARGTALYFEPQAA
jgi:II/X family phage/plasmid replication protein